MARKSTKENKNIYQRTREALDLTREEASDLLITMSPERIEKIESERSMPHPDEVLLMSDQYLLFPFFCGVGSGISSMQFSSCDFKIAQSLE